MSVSGYCSGCRNFRNDASFLEAAFPGLTALSSASGSTRSDDGICLLHDRYLAANSCCPEFSPQEKTHAGMSA
jgi:hypothetical protein